MGEVIKIAVQKSGRLSEKSLKLLSECGIKINSGISKLISKSSNFPIEVLYLRDDDIPQYVADGVADLGIVGENVLIEKDSDLDLLDKLGFSKCRMCLAVPKSVEYTDVRYFDGKQIATSYPKILQNFLDKQGINAGIHEISGSVEIAPGIGLADGIFDIVSTGSTLLTNGLKEVEVVLKSEAVLIANKSLCEEKNLLIKKLLFRLNTVRKAKDNKYILLNAPNDKLDDIISVIPGMKSPTITPLAEDGWSSLHSVVNENDFWDVIDKLKKYGAQGILVVPIEKMIV